MADNLSLPVWLHRQEITDALSGNQVIVVESPTGSGKTTQIPVILKEAGYAELGIIGVTQPRRIAAIGVCSYIQKSLSDSNLPSRYCGYKIRFYDETDDTTRIKILTDGMLLQEIKTDPLLSDYSVIMVDEAHERSLNIDFILGMLKQILEKRQSLKVIISSATINTKSFSKFFWSAPIINIKTRIFDVTTKYFPVNNEENAIQNAICQILSVIVSDFIKSGCKESKDTLVFLPGEADIKNTINAIYSLCDTAHIQIFPLYGRLGKDEQELVFNPADEGKVKVVLATNIAETSITINGIKCVIDSGLAKMNFYNQEDFTSALVTRQISRSSALQRLGRAGRTAPGTCYRLYSKESYEQRPMYTLQEILRTDLSEVVLRMIDLGITKFESFPFITKPDKNSLLSGEKTLNLIGAIDKERHLTNIGKLMVSFPLIPRLSRCAVQAILYHSESIFSVMVCISFLSCRTPFLFPAGEEDIARAAQRHFSNEHGDFVSYQILYKDYTQCKDNSEKEKFCNTYYLDKQGMDEIVHVTNQLCSITREMGIPVTEKYMISTENDINSVITCMASGLQQYICVKQHGSVFSTITTDEILIHPGSSYFRNPPQYILAGEIVMTTKMYARTVSPITEECISEANPFVLKLLKKKIPKSANNKIAKSVQETSFKTNTKNVNLFGYTFSTIALQGGKKSSLCAVIPASQLDAFSRTYKRSRRKPKNINACISMRKHYIAFGERLSDIVRLSGRLNLNDNTEIVKPCSKRFSLDEAKDSSKYFNQLIKLAESPKNKSILGFVELVSSGNSIFFHVNSSYSEAINNTAYTLLSLGEISDNPVFNDTYNKIIKMLD